MDNICAFIRPGEAVLAWTDDENDPQYVLSKENLEVLKNETDAKGRSLTVHKLPIPEKHVFIKEEDLLGYEFEEGEDEREVGERLAASYVNFYFSNGAVILPAFGGENTESDIKTVRNTYSIRSRSSPAIYLDIGDIPFRYIYIRNPFRYTRYLAFLYLLIGFCKFIYYDGTMLTHDTEISIS